MVLTCKKGQGNAIGYFLRQLVLTSVECWRPVAFIIENRKTNILYSEGDIVEDMLEVQKNLADLVYVCDDDSIDFFEETYTFTNALTVNDLANGSVVKAQLNGNDNKNVITCTNSSEVQMKIIFRKTAGVCSMDDNFNFIEQHHSVTSDTNVLNSIHSIVKRFAFSIQEKANNTEEINITMESLIPNEKGILIQCIEEAKEILSSMLEELN